MAGLLARHSKEVAKTNSLLIKDRRLGPVAVKTTLNPVLQKRAENLLRSRSSRRAAMVVVEANTGRVLVMAGVRKRRVDPRVALDASAPAASLFKVITAAAALEETNLIPSSKLRYAGRPHTLYRYQVKNQTRRKTRRISLRKSFAESNNPVFARLGAHRLGENILSTYAHALGFDRKLRFELPVGISRMAQADTKYEVGEVASGYHRATTTSPLHAALMVAVFVSGGRFLEPYLVERATGAGGEVLYLGRPQASRRLVSSQTCRQMRQLFEATVSEGTARKAFRRLNRDRVLKHLKVGGKTGTLRGPDRKELFEWFAGYARHPRTGKTLAVATLAVHGKYRRTNPKALARQIMRQAFQVSSTRAGKM
jgi:cell division protein FtsI/penicillin-binding protein 2